MNINFLLKKVKIIMIFEKINFVEENNAPLPTEEIYSILLMLRDYFVLTHPDRKTEPSWACLKYYENIFHIENLHDILLTANDFLTEQLKIISALSIS